VKVRRATRRRRVVVMNKGERKEKSLRIYGEKKRK
jgi:hypothetical protein